jgi:hypothetical protein
MKHSVVRYSLALLAKKVSTKIRQSRAKPAVTSMNDINREGRTSLWPNKKLDCEKLFIVRCQLNANSYSTPDGASGDAIHYAGGNGETHSFLRRDLRGSNDPSNYVVVYCFLFLFCAVCCRTRYVVEEGFTALSSVQNLFYISSADMLFNFFNGFSESATLVKSTKSIGSEHPQRRGGGCQDGDLAQHGGKHVDNCGDGSIHTSGSQRIYYQRAPVQGEWCERYSQVA